MSINTFGFLLGSPRTPSQQPQQQQRQQQQQQQQPNEHRRTTMVLQPRPVYRGRSDSVTSILLGQDFFVPHPAPVGLSSLVALERAAAISSLSQPQPILVDTTNLEMGLAALTFHPQPFHPHNINSINNNSINNHDSGGKETASTTTPRDESSKCTSCWTPLPNPQQPLQQQQQPLQQQQKRNSSNNNKREYPPPPPPLNAPEDIQLLSLVNTTSSSSHCKRLRTNSELVVDAPRLPSDLDDQPTTSGSSSSSSSNRSSSIKLHHRTGWGWVAVPQLGPRFRDSEEKQDTPELGSDDEDDPLDTCDAGCGGVSVGSMPILPTFATPPTVRAINHLKMRRLQEAALFVPY